MKDLKKNFGQRIRKIRQKHNLSQEELAEKVDIAVNNIGKIERGESFVTAATLQKLAEVLGVKVHDFFIFDTSLSIDDMKKELDIAHMPDNQIKMMYKFYKYFVE